MILQDVIVGKRGHCYFTAKLKKELKKRHEKIKKSSRYHEANIRLRDENIRNFLERSKKNDKQKI